MKRSSCNAGKRKNDTNSGNGDMTYNFDPERWYEGEFDFMERELKQGRLTKSEFDQKVAALMKKYDDMTRRLDGTYQLPE